jgi:hypothetical protein
MLIESVLIKFEFWALVLTSLALPVVIIWHLLRIIRISRTVLIAYACMLIALAGLDVVLITYVASLAKATRGIADDQVFRSEYTLALYLLPLISAGVGINLLSFAITQHLKVQSSIVDES